MCKWIDASRGLLVFHALRIASWLISRRYICCCLGMFASFESSSHLDCFVGISLIDDALAGSHRSICRFNLRCRSWSRAPSMGRDRTKHFQNISCTSSTTFLMIVSCAHLLILIYSTLMRMRLFMARLFIANYRFLYNSGEPLYRHDRVLLTEPFSFSFGPV